MGKESIHRLSDFSEEVLTGERKDSIDRKAWSHGKRVFSVSARVMARDDRPSTGNLNSCSQVW
jgi:hypothetical protein